MSSHPETLAPCPAAPLPWPPSAYWRQRGGQPRPENNKTFRTRGHINNDIWPANRIRRKHCFVVIRFLGIGSLQSFAHATTAQLSWHVQNFVTIAPLAFGWEQNEISTEFDFRWGNRLWNGPAAGRHTHQGLRRDIDAQPAVTRRSDDEVIPLGIMTAMRKKSKKPIHTIYQLSPTKVTSLWIFIAGHL